MSTLSAEAVFQLPSLVLPEKLTEARRVHQVRVHGKRLLAVGQCLRAVEAAPSSQLKRVLKAVRAANRELAALRDGHVLAEACEGLAGRVRRETLREALRMLAAECREEGAVVMPCLRVQMLLQEQGGLLQQWCETVPRMELLEAGLRRCFRKARRWRERASRQREENALHEWRRWVKHLSHVLLLWGADKHHPEVAGWLRLGTLLGEEHDLFNLERYIAAHLQVEEARRPLLALLHRRRRRLQDEALRLADALVLESAPVFARRWVIVLTPPDGDVPAAPERTT